MRTLAYEEALAECREDHQRRCPGLYGRDVGSLQGDGDGSVHSSSGGDRKDGNASGVRPLGAAGAVKARAGGAKQDDSAGLPPELPWMDWLKVR